MQCAVDMIRMSICLSGYRDDGWWPMATQHHHKLLYKRKYRTTRLKSSCKYGFHATNLLSTNSISQAIYSTKLTVSVRNLARKLWKTETARTMKSLISSDANYEVDISSLHVGMQLLHPNVQGLVYRRVSLNMDTKPHSHPYEFSRKTE